MISVVYQTLSVITYPITHKKTKQETAGTIQLPRKSNEKPTFVECNQDNRISAIVCVRRQPSQTFNHYDFPIQVAKKNADTHTHLLPPGLARKKLLPPKVPDFHLASQG